MPEQLLWRDRALIGRSRWHLRLARLALVVLWILGVAAFAWTLYRVLSVEAPTQLQLVFWVLSTICFAWVSIGAITAVIGFVSLAAARGSDTLGLPAGTALPQDRTALLFPVYREEPTAVATTIDTMCRELLAARAGALFDVFIILSLIHI